MVHGQMDPENGHQKHSIYSIISLEMKVSSGCLTKIFSIDTMKYGERESSIAIGSIGMLPNIGLLSMYLGPESEWSNCFIQLLLASRISSC